MTLTLAANTGSLARTGYTFAGWNTTADGSGTSYAASASYTANAGVTLYARWTANTYAVTYHANSATSGTAPSAQTKTHDVALTLAANTGSLARTGFAFAGWNTTADGSGTSYAVGASYTMNVAVTLYATWLEQVPLNNAPVANDASVTTDVDAPIAVSLNATDANAGDVLAYTVLTVPAHGTLSGSVPNLTYTPNVGWSGSDSFTFKAHDGQVDSNTATITITVRAVNDALVTPTAGGAGGSCGFGVAGLLLLVGTMFVGRLQSREAHLATSRHSHGT